MQSLLVILTLIVAAALFMSWVASRPRGNQLRSFANIGEGFQPANKTYLSDAVIATRHLVGKIGSSAAHVALCGVGDIPLGMITDEAPAIGDGVNVNLFGLEKECALGVASAEILEGAFIVPAASGKLRTLPVAAGTYYIIGRALKTAAADNDDVEFVPCFPIQRVVAG